MTVIFFVFENISAHNITETKKCLKNNHLWFPFGVNKNKLKVFNGDSDSVEHSLKDAVMLLQGCLNDN
jgi:hypothetical protein